jgi:hypothetical protein
MPRGAVAMPLYRFYFLGDGGEVHNVRAVETREDSIAIGRAEQFLAVKSNHVAIEIWRGEGFVKGVRRDGTRYDRSPVHLHSIKPR